MIVNELNIFIKPLHFVYDKLSLQYEPHMTCFIIPTSVVM